MAPNLAVKSDSWLDLSISAPVPSIKPKGNSELARFTSSPTGHRHSISDFYPVPTTAAAANCKSNTLNSDTTSNTRKATVNNDSSNNNSRYGGPLLNSNSSGSGSSNNSSDRTTNYKQAHVKSPLASLLRTGGTRSSSCNQIINQCNSNNNSGAKQANAHLLIRMRQQSYLNRSSTTTLSSDLSNSIDLTESSVGRRGAAREKLHDKAKLFDDHDDDENNLLLLADHVGHNKQQTPVIRGAHEPRRLASMRQRLRQRGGGGGAVGVGGPTLAGANDGRQASSPLVRSLSSFSERLSGKLSHFRHSWKHFLYNYNRGSGKGPEEVASDDMARLRWRYSELHAGRPSSAGPAELSRANYSEGGLESRRQMTDEWLERHHPGLTSDSDPDLGTRRQAISSGNLLERFEQPKAPIGDSNGGCGSRGAAEQHGLRRVDINRDIPASLSSPSASSSTSTLVSQPPAAAATDTSVSPASTLNSSPLNTTMSKQSIKRLSSVETAADVAPVFAAADELLDEKGVIAPTSDYWSTVNSSDYYKQLLQQVPSPLCPPPINAVNANNRQQHLMLRLDSSPILLSDQEYYLDVARSLDPQGSGLQDARFMQQHMSSHQVNQHQQQLLLQYHLNRQQQQQYPAPPQLPDVAQDEDYDDYAVPSDENCRLDRSQVELVQMIGEGQKGYVFLGKLQSKDGRTITDVAIKTLKYETEQLIEKLMREAAMMRQFEHPHIIKFIGVCPETPALIAMELAEFGEVKQYLKLHKHLICVSQLVLFTFQISTALSYLESKHYVHRDVAARNVLVCSHNCVKLADFGLSRNLQSPNQTDLFLHNLIDAASEQILLDKSDQRQQQQQQYVAASRGKLPVRWLAPESLAFRRFTSASDVWMFAVCSWEFFQFGQMRPWAHIRNNQVLLAIESGQRLARPAHCPARLYQLLLQCWSYAPIQRPKFRELKQSLWSIYLNERAKEQVALEQLEQQQQLEQHQLQMQQQQLQLQLQLQQQQIQPQRVMVVPAPDADRLPQERLAEMMLRNSSRNKQPAATATDAGCLQWIASQHQRQYRPDAVAAAEIPPPSQQASLKKRNMNLLPLDAQRAGQYNHADRFSASPLMTTSGYSSGGATTATATATATEHSPLNSSRSSSMGSFAQRPQQHQQKALAPIERQQQGGDAGRLAKIDQNIKRFQRAPGHMLQKQRSQGSIVSRPHAGSGNDLYAATNRHRPLYGFDDQALGRLGQRGAERRRPQSELHLATARMNGQEVEDDDEGDSEEEDSEQETTISRQPPPYTNRSAGADHEITAQSGHLRPFEQPGIQVVESTYDGIGFGAQPSEIAMLRGDPAHLQQNQRMNNQMCGRKQQPGVVAIQQKAQRGDKSAGRSSRAAAAAAEEEAKRVEHEQKLADIIEALKVAPMKAKLTYKLDSGSSMHRHSDAAARATAAEHVQHASRSGNVQTTTTQTEAAQEEQRQLALHRRLLGHIRPASKRQPTKLQDKQTSSSASSATQQQSSGSPKEIVDQSLQILESLISEKQPRFAPPTIHDKQVRAAQTSVAQIAEFQRKQAKQQQRSQRPKSVSQATTTSKASAFFSQSPT